VKLFSPNWYYKQFLETTRVNTLIIVSIFYALSIYLSTVNSFLSVEYQFSWLSSASSNHEIVCIMKVKCKKRT